jgi:glycosyltransferase involved in cell wall biosynthesis
MPFWLKKTPNRFAAELPRLQKHHFEDLAGDVKDPLARMKVLFDHPAPFLLAHGGFQIQIEQTKAALEKVGVAVEYLRWWDEGQTGGIIHYFGRPVAGYIEFAHRKGIRVVLAELLTGTGSRGVWSRRLQRVLIRATKAIVPPAFSYRMGWESYRLADACVAGTPWEKKLMVEMFDAPSEKVHCIPIGVGMEFLESSPGTRGPWLLCTATITPRKRVLEVAEAAVEAQTPTWIIGKPYPGDDDYARQFESFACNNPRFIRYNGAIADRKQLAAAYREARGFVLLSTMESLSLSSFEAAACGCPLLLSDLPWARSTFDDHATYCPVNISCQRTARVLRHFYDAAPGLPAPPKPQTWPEMARELVKLYERLASTSR